MMEIRFKKLEEGAVVPFKKDPTDAGFDITAIDYEFDEFGNVVYKTGLALEIPEGYVGLLFPRSSISKYCLSLANSVGVIDSGYRGEIKLKFKPTIAFNDRLDDMCNAYDVGERIAQLIIIPYPNIEFVESDELSDSDRGAGGFGSTGK